MEKSHNLMLLRQPERPSSAAVSSSSPPPAAPASPVQRPHMDLLPCNHSGYFSPVQLHPLPPPWQCPPNTAGGSPPDHAGKRLGIPPLSPHFPLFPPLPSLQSQAAGAAARSPPSAAAAAAASSLRHPFHARSLSQPPYFSLDNLPPLTLPPTPLADVMMDASAPPPALPIPRTPTGRSPGDGLPPRKAHRRSQSDIPVSVGVFLQPPSPVMATTPPFPQRLRPYLAKQEEKEPERSAGTEVSGDGSSDGGEDGDDLINAYMNWDGLESLNSSGAEEKQEDLDSSKMSGTRTTNGADSSDNEAESSNAIESGASVENEMKGGNKRLAAADLAPMSSRHARSLSMDSLMSKLHFGEESLKFPPSPGNQMGQHPHNGSIDGTMNGFSSGSRSSEFSNAEMKKIMANGKLVEMALADPKKVKRVLANRQSAARSKERKMRYISELEHKVQTLQTEATTLSAQLTLLQRDSTGFTSQNNELKFRIQAMEQQGQLRDALHQALTEEVQRLKLAAGDISESKHANSFREQMPANAQMFRSHQLHLHSQQSSQVPLYPSQPSELHKHKQQQQQQQISALAKPDPNQS